MPLAAGWLAWEIGPDLPGARASHIPDEKWALPQVQTPELRKAYDFLSAANIWGKVEAAKVEEPVRDPAWRFLAVMINGSEKSVLIDVEKQPNRQLKVGDSLPGGAVIHDIKQDSLCVVVNGKKRMLPLDVQDRQPL